MALTPSKMLPLGTVAPDFSLPDPNGEMHSLNEVPNEKAYLVIFMCNHCPYVLHIQKELSALVTRYQSHGVSVFGINSNDAEKYPADRPEKMLEDIKRYRYTFPYLYDETQSVAKAYDAACTPDFFLFDSNKKLVYRGQFDDSRPGNNIPVTGKDLSTAIDTVLQGKTPSQNQRPSMGCNIKWK